MERRTIQNSEDAARLSWRPSAEEVEAIMAEMRPVIDALAALEQDRLARFGAGHRATRPRSAHRTAAIRGLEEELGRDVLVALLNENSFSRRRRVSTLRLKVAWAQSVAFRRALRMPA